jgi:hypothetical protein
MRDWVRTIETPPAVEVLMVDDLVRTAVTRAQANRTPSPAVQIDDGPAAQAAGAAALADALGSLIEAVARAAEPGETVRVSWAPDGEGTRISIRRGDRPDADPSGTFDAELMGGLGFALPLARAIVEAGGGQLTSRRDAQGRLDAVTLLLAPATPPR